MTALGSPADEPGVEGASDGSPSGRATLRTLVLADLVDSTRVVEALGDRRASELFARHDGLARELIERFDGVEIDKTDGFFLLFGRPVDAVGFAVAYHGALEGLASAVPGLPVLRARVGIHLGEVYLRDNAPEHVARGAKPVEAEGLSKPITARLMSLARPGQTLLTAAAFQLAQRSARGEPSAEGLRWIEHGPYRFQGVEEPVEVYEVGAPGKAPAARPGPSPKAWPADGDGAPWWRRRLPVMAAAAVVGAALVAAGLRFGTSPGSEPAPTPIAERDWIVVGTFQNPTGRAGLGDALGQGLRTSLEQSSHFLVIPTTQVNHVLTRMRRSPDTVVDRTVGLEICQREGAAALVLGSVVELGGGFDVSVEIVQPPDGRTVAVEKAHARGEEDLLRTIEGLARKTRAHLGESLPSIRNHSQPLEKVTTANLDALRAYSLGLRAVIRGDGHESAELLRQAVRLDDEFATAHARLGTVAFHLLGDEKTAVAHWDRALDLTDRLREQEKLYIEGSRAWLGPPSAMRRPWFLLSTLHPEELAGHANLGFVEWWYERRYEAAAEAFEACTRTRDPRRATCWNDLAYCQLALGREQEAVASFERATEGRTISGAGPADGYLAVRRYEDAARYLTSADHPPDTLLRLQGRLKTVTYHLDRGELAAALKAARDLSEEIGDSGKPEWLLQTKAAEAALLESLGRRRELLDLLRHLQVDGTRELDTAPVGQRFVPSLRLALLGKVSVRNGDVERGGATLEVLRRALSGIDSRLAGAHLDLLEAEILLAEGRAGEAVELLGASIDRIPLFQAHETLARAHEARGNLRAALAEVEWLREHRGLAFAEWLGQFFGRELHLLDWAEAAYDQGRLSERLGDAEAAHRHYRELLDHWPEVADAPPWFRLAEARLGALQGSEAPAAASGR